MLIRLPLQNRVRPLNISHQQRNDIILTDRFFISKKIIRQLHFYSRHYLPFRNRNSIGSQRVVRSRHRDKRLICIFKIKIVTQGLIHFKVYHHIVSISISSTPSSFYYHLMLIVKSIIHKFTLTKLYGTKSVLVGKIYCLVIEIRKFIVTTFA